jgi:hypothetical protein
VIDARDVTACLVTRGDVDLEPILSSLIFRNVLVWDNSRLEDLGAAGRYEAATRALGDVIYTQDDDCLVPPEVQLALLESYAPGILLSNMDPNHNGTAMPYLALPGWGSLFDADLPEQAWAKWAAAGRDDFKSDSFRRIGCDIVFPVLTSSKMIDLGHENLPYAWDSHRTNLRPGYAERKGWYYQRAAEIRQTIEAA